MFVDGRPETIQALFAFLVAAVLAGCWFPSRSGSRGGSGRSTTRTPQPAHRPTPKLGGLAIFVGTSVAAILFLPWAEQTQALLIGAVVIVTVGVLDDVFDLHPMLKLAGQMVAAAIPVLNGVNAELVHAPVRRRVNLRSVELFDVGLIGSVHLGHLLTIIGIVAVINVINLIDGVDGLAAGVCVISAASLSVIALSLESPAPACSRR